MYRLDLTIRFLKSRSCRSSSVFLRFASSWIRDEHVTIVSHQKRSQFILGVFVHVLGMIGDNRLGNGGPNGIHLRCDTTPRNSNANVQITKLVLSDNQDGFVDLVPQLLRFQQFQRLTIDLDQTTTLFAKGHSRCCLFPRLSEKEKE